MLCKANFNRFTNLPPSRISWSYLIGKFCIFDSWIKIWTIHQLETLPQRQKLVQHNPLILLSSAKEESFRKTVITNRDFSFVIFYFLSILLGFLLNFVFDFFCGFCVVQHMMYGFGDDPNVSISQLSIFILNPHLLSLIRYL